LEREGVKRLSLFKPNLRITVCRFTVTPAVALLYYVRSGRLLRIFFLNLDFSRGFLYTSLISRKEQRSCDGRGGGHILGCIVAHFRVLHSSFRVVRRSEGCSVAQIGCSVAQTVVRWHAVRQARVSKEIR
jgi:hypothetical protein